MGTASTRHIDQSPALLLPSLSRQSVTAAKELVHDEARHCWHPSIHKGNSFVCFCRRAAPAWQNAARPLGSHLCNRDQLPGSTEGSAELPGGAEITMVGQISPPLTNTSALVHWCPLARSLATTQLNRQVFYPAAQLHLCPRTHRTISLKNSHEQGRAKAKSQSQHYTSQEQGNDPIAPAGSPT